MLSSFNVRALRIILFLASLWLNSSVAKGDDASPVSATPATAPAQPRAGSPIKSTIVGKGAVPWEEILRDPNAFLGHTVALDCRGVRLFGYPLLTQSNSVARLPRGDNGGRYQYGLSLGAGGDMCRLASASHFATPLAETDALFTGVWTRFGTNWSAGATGAVYGLRLTTVAFKRDATNEFQAGYSLHPQFESMAPALFQRTENLIEVLTQYNPSMAHERYAKLFPSPVDAPPAFLAEIHKRIADGFEANESPDGDLLKELLQLHDILDANARKLRDQQNNRGFAVQRTRATGDIVAALRDLCHGKFPGRVEADRFRLWFVNRLILFGDLLEARTALGPCAAPQALESAYGPTCSLLGALGERLPDFEIVKEDGSKVSSKSLRGKWVVLYFKMSERPSAWRNFYRDFIRQLEAMETGGEFDLTHVVVPLNRNQGTKWLNMLGIRTEPQIVILSPGGYVCYFNSPSNPQIPTADVFRAWILDRAGGRGRAGRVLESLGIEENDAK